MNVLSVSAELANGKIWVLFKAWVSYNVPTRRTIGMESA
jgi:hypothetical protein